MVGWPTGHRGIRLQADPRKNEVAAACSHAAAIHGSTLFSGRPATRRRRRRAQRELRQPQRPAKRSSPSRGLSFRFDFENSPAGVTRVLAHASDVATYCCGAPERSKLAASWNLRGGGASPGTGSSASSVVPTVMFARSATRRVAAASCTTINGRSRKPGTQSSRDTGSTPSARRQASRSSSRSTGKAFAPDPATTSTSTSTTCRPAVVSARAAAGTRAARRASAATTVRRRARFAAPSRRAGAQVARAPRWRSS